MIPHSRPTIDEDDIKAVAEVMRSGHIAEGHKVEEFERAMASYIGVNGAVALSSGTASLHLSLLSLGVKDGDEVIMPSYTCSALLNAVMTTGAKPRLIDIEKGSYNIDPGIVEDYIRKKKGGGKVKAIILVHTFGLPVDIDAFLDISNKYSIPLIEDSAQALGATFKGKKVGGFGLISVLSFYATKVITTGEGGMLLSNSREILEKARDIREYDKKEAFKVRYNYKMTDMAAALGINQMKRIDSFLKDREEIARSYDEYLKNLFQIPLRPKGSKRIYYRYVIESKRVERLIGLMEGKGVVCKRPVFKPLHRYIGQKGFPNTELAWRRSISIPIYPSLSSEDVRMIADSLIGLKEMMG